MSDPSTPGAPRRPPIARRAGGSSPGLRQQTIRVDDPAEPKPPLAVLYLRLFCVFVCLLLIGATGFIGYMATEAKRRSSDDPDLWLWILLGGGVYLVLFGLYTVPLWVRTPCKRDWWLGLALIVLSLLTLYLSVFALPLLIGWLLPTTRAYHSRVKSPIPEVSS